MLILKNLRQVLTLGEKPVPRRGSDMSNLGIVENGAILVQGEDIAWVGPTRDLPASEGGARCEVVDGAGRDLVALPGFVDSHTHPVFAGLRADEYDLRTRGKSYQDIAALGGGIRASVRQVRASTLDQLVERAEQYADRFLAHGTTSIEAKSGYGLSLEEELKMLRAIDRLRHSTRLDVVPTLLGAHDVPEEYSDRRAEYVRLVAEEMIPAASRDGLADFCDVFCDEGYFSVEESRKILLSARREGLGLRIHAEQLAPSGGALLAAELGARSADHLEWIDDEGIEAMGKSGTVATLLPGTAFNLGLPQFPPARRLIRAGVPVALATDFNPGSCFTLNMQIILSIACSQMKLTPAEAITAATINAAYSIGLEGRLGTLESGKQADIVVTALGDYRELPYFFGVNHCVLTVKRGNVVINRLEDS